MMAKEGLSAANYARFATRWKTLSELKREKVTLILSPHLDDIFLSLYSTIVSGKLGRNIIGVNFFTSTDSTVATNVDTTFTTIVETSLIRMREELDFSSLLLSRRINYLPVFLGLKDASVGKYYGFIASGVLGKLPDKAGMRSLALKIYAKMAADYSNELNIWEALKPLLKQFKSNIRSIVAPMGVGTHIDHGVVAHSALHSASAINFGFYAEIPYTYISGNISVDKLHVKAPKDFTKLMLTKFDPREKDRLFKKLYGSQYEGRTSKAIFEVGEKLGEIVFWKE
jgi:hypothetical protein